MIVVLLTEPHLEFLSLKGGCRDSSESTHVNMPHCWKSHALAQLNKPGNCLDAIIFDNNGLGQMFSISAFSTDHEIEEPFQLVNSVKNHPLSTI